jgi:hypothetical protein
MVLNAAKNAGAVVSSDEEMITQDAVLRKTADGDWVKITAAQGAGLTLDQFGHLIETAFKAFGFKVVSAEVYHAQKSDEFRKKLHAALIENELSNHDFIIADFNQSSFVGDVEVDHVAPVGAFDAVKDRVLIMDPDRQWYAPYWVSESTFLDGMATADKITGMSRGFIWVKFAQ